LADIGGDRGCSISQKKLQLRREKKRSIDEKSRKKKKNLKSKECPAVKKNDVRLRGRQKKKKATPGSKNQTAVPEPKKGTRRKAASRGRKKKNRHPEMKVKTDRPPGKNRDPGTGNNRQKGELSKRGRGAVQRESHVFGWEIPGKKKNPLQEGKNPVGGGFLSRICLTKGEKGKKG